jgi:pyruvate,water dikinase
LAGGKGKVLARLFQEKYPVPEGLIIFPSAFSGDDLTPVAEILFLSKLEKIRARQKSPVDFAVRSSALSEDSAKTSFAGEFETELNVQTNENVIDAVKKVRLSRHSERVESYSEAKGMPSDHDMAVVVQVMIHAEISGVLFTAEPVTGDTSKITGNFVNGLGEVLVSGESNAEKFTVVRPKMQYVGPAEMKKHAMHLARVAISIEKKRCCPQDIEWAVAGGRLFILQARPITTMSDWDPETGILNESFTGNYVWTANNAGEAVGEVLTPLSASFFKYAMKVEEILPDVATIGLLGNRAYFNLSCLQSLATAIRMQESMLVELLGELPYIQIPLLPIGRMKLLSMILSVFFKVERKKNNGWKHADEYIAENPRRVKDYIDKINALTDLKELETFWLDDIESYFWDGSWAMLGAGDPAGHASMKLRKRLKKLIGDEKASTLISSYSRENQLLESAGPMLGLELVAKGKITKEEYLSRYGHRCASEIEMAQPRPIDIPGWVDDQVARLQESGTDLESLQAKARQEYLNTLEYLHSKYPSKAKKLGRQLENLAFLARKREAARSEYSRFFRVIQAFFLRIAELSGIGQDIFYLSFEEALDLLNGKQVNTAVLPTRKEAYQRLRDLPSYPLIIKGRFDPLVWASSPNRRTDIFDSTEMPPVNESDTIKGAPGASGEVDGIVHVIHTMDEADQFQAGEILVTVQTNVGWTILFPKAAAIVTDVGAALSHSAIVAREFGIPAVVGCGDATMRLKTGDRVLVDGGQGTVRILEK